MVPVSEIVFERWALRRSFTLCHPIAWASKVNDELTRFGCNSGL
jgi:hypothetical protein